MKNNSGPSVNQYIFVLYLEKLYVKDETELSPPEQVQACERNGEDLMKDFTKEELHLVYKTLCSKGKSCDGFSPNDLKILEGLTIKPMVEIFNDVLEKGEFPKTWLVAKVLFFHKSGNWREPANFRSIHIQQAVLKLFNKAMAKRLNKFLEDHQILNSSQFAYRKNLGTTGGCDNFTLIG